MKKSKTLLTCLFLACGLPQGVMANAEISEQAIWAIQHAAEKNEEDFIVLDKVNATLMVFDDGEEILRTPVFIGRAKVDTIQQRLDATPAGDFATDIWDVEGRGAVERAGTIIPFSCSRTKKAISCYAMHPTLENAQEKNAKDSAISNGCVRVPLSAYHKIVQFIRETKAATGQAPRLRVAPYNMLKINAYFKDRHILEPR